MGILAFNFIGSSWHTFIGNHPVQFEISYVENRDVLILHKYNIVVQFVAT